MIFGPFLAIRKVIDGTFVTNTGPIYTFIYITLTKWKV